MERPIRPAGLGYLIGDDSPMVKRKGREMAGLGQHYSTPEGQRVKGHSLVLGLYEEHQQFPNQRHAPVAMGNARQALHQRQQAALVGSIFEHHDHGQSASAIGAFIASHHVIEHLEDYFSFLRDIQQGIGKMHKYPSYRW